MTSRNKSTEKEKQRNRNKVLSKLHLPSVIHEQFRDVDFKHNYSPTSSSSSSITSNTGPIRIFNIQIPVNLRNLGMELTQHVTVSDVVDKVIRNGDVIEENNHTTEDKIKDFVQKEVHKKFQEVCYQFSSIVSLLPEVLIKSRELSTTKGYWG